MVQVEDVEVGDVIIEWMPGKAAQVVEIKKRFGTNITLHVEPVKHSDFIPSVRIFKIGQTVSILEESK